MDVLVDGQSNFQLDGSPEDLMAVVGAVSEFLLGQDRAMISIAVDGEDVPHEDLQTYSGGHPVAGIKRIEVASRPIAEMITESLDDLEASIPELPGACRKLAAVFHGDAPEEGYDPFNALADIWSHVKQRQAMVATTLNIDLDTLALGDKRIDELHTELNGFLEEAAQAITDGDCVLLGDLLEYELAPRAENEVDIVALLREKAAAASQ